jgi:omega-amidase
MLECVLTCRNVGRQCSCRPFAGGSHQGTIASLAHFFRNAACPQAAKEHGIYIVGGSVPEVEVQSDGTKRVYNTSITVDPTGRVVAKHRKV